MSTTRRENDLFPQVTYGDTRIEVDPDEAPMLIAGLAVAANPTNPVTTLQEAGTHVADFDNERAALYRGLTNK